MTRPSFTTSIRGTGQRRTGPRSGPYSPVTVLDVLHAEEKVSGVSRRKPSGWIPPTPYSLRRVKYQRPQGYLEARYKYSSSIGSLYELDWLAQPSNILNDWNQTRTVGASIDADLYDQALIKARVKLKNMQVNLGQAFFERKMTTRLVSENLTSIAKAGRALRHGDWRKASRHLGIHRPRRPRGQAFPQRWLELQYGWKPLLSDIYGAVSALDNADKSDWRVTIKASSLRELKGGRVTSDNATLYRQDNRFVETQGCFVRIDAIPDKDHIVSLASLGVTNPLSIAWELVPFSFVVDWALPVGSYLEGLDAMLGYNSDETYTSVSKFRRTRWETSYLPGTDTSNYVFRGDYGNCYKEDLWVGRSVGTGVPFPIRPHLKDPASLGHLANALSLLAQVFSK